MPTMNDATSALIRGLSGHFDNFAHFALENIRSRSWASVTFSGARHEVGFRLEGEEAGTAADRFLERLDCAEVEIRGHILADIALVWQERGPGFVRISLEALTVEDR